MANWWKCQVWNKNRGNRSLTEGKVVFAKVDAEWARVYDGKREFLIPRFASKDVRLISRVTPKYADLIEQDFQARISGKSCGPDRCYSSFIVS